MFSNHFRIVKIIVLFLIISALCWYSHLGRRELTLEQCRSDPEHFAGREVPLYIDTRILEIQPDRLVISQPGGPVEVMVSGGTQFIQARPGEFFQAQTVFKREGYLELKEISLAPLRRLKIAISFFPLLLVMVVLIRMLRWEEGYLILKE